MTTTRRDPITVDGDTGEIVRNFDTGPLVSQEVERQIATAHRYPRSVSTFRKEVRSLVTLSPSIAETCLFALPRGGKIIQGPSVRFAEVAASQWGNCRVWSSIVGEDDHYVKAMGVFWDLQSNSAIGFEVRRSIRYSDDHNNARLRGQRYNADMIGTTGNAAASIALRNAALRGIPRALWDDIYLEAVRCAKGDVATLRERRAAAIDAFKKYGITEANIFARLGVSGLDDIKLDELAILRGFLTAIIQEDRDPDEIFVIGKPNAGAPKEPPASSGGSSKAQADKGSPATGGSALPLDPPPPPPGEAEPPESALLASIADVLVDCRTPKDCDGVFKLFQREIIDEPSPQVRAAIETLIEKRKAEISASAADDFPGDREVKP